MTGRSTRYGKALAKAIGQRVRTLRSCRSLTQVEFAKLAGMERPILARLEAGRHLPSLLTLADVAAALGLELSSLLVGIERTAHAARHVAAAE